MQEIYEIDDFLDGDHVKELFGGEIITLLKTITTYMYCGIIVGSNSEKPFALWNKRATEILGIGATNTLKEDWPKIYGLKDPITKEYLPAEEVPLAIALSGRSVKDRLIYVENETKKIYIVCTAYPVFNGDQVVGGVVVFQDMTEETKKIQIIEQMQAQISKLESLNQTIQKKFQKLD